MSKRKILIRNVIYGFAAQSILLLLKLATTPYIVHGLGVEVYGILSICLVINGFASMLDFRIGQAIIKFISEHYAKNDQPEIERIIKTSLLFYLIVGLAGGILIIAAAPLFILVVFKIPDYLQELSYFAFYMTALIFFIKIRTNLFQSITMALQRFDIFNKIYTGLMCAEVSGSVLLLYKGYHLKAILVWHAIIALIQFIAFNKVTKGLLLHIRFNFGFNIKIFKKLFSFGSKVLIQDTSGRIIAVTDKILIGSFLSIGYLPFYIIPYNIALNLQLVIMNFVQIIFPEASGLYGQRHKQALEKLYFKAGKYLFIILFPITSLLVIFAKPLLYYWIGPDFAQNSAFVLQVLSLSIFILCSGSLSRTILIAIDKLNIVTKASILCALCNLLLCFSLIPIFKLKGAALAFGIAHTLLSIWLTRYLFKNIFKIPVLKLFTKGFYKLIVFCAVFLLYLILVKIFVIRNILTLSFCLLGVTIYILSVYFYILDSKDKEMMQSCWKSP